MHLLQHGGGVNGGRRGFQKKLLGGAENLRPQLQPHLGQPRLSPAAGGLLGGRHQHSQPAAENQPRERRIIPDAADRHHHQARRPRRETAHPLALKRNHADHARETQHRRHGNARHLRQIQPQPSKHRSGEGVAHCQRTRREIAQAKIRRRGSLRQRQHRHAAHQPVGDGGAPAQRHGEQQSRPGGQNNPQEIDRHRHGVPQHQLEQQPGQRRQERGNGGKNQRLLLRDVPGKEQRQQPAGGRPHQPLQPRDPPEDPVAQHGAQTHDRRMPAAHGQNQPHRQGLGIIAQTGCAEQKSAAAAQKDDPSRADFWVQQQPLTRSPPPPQIRFHGCNHFHHSLSLVMGKSYHG